MPSLPALPTKNSPSRESVATNVLYNKATREYLTRNFSAALSTLAIYRSQPLSLKSKRKCFSLYVAILDSITSLSESDVKLSLGRDGVTVMDKLRSGSIWREAESYYEEDVPGDVAINIILSLTKHMVDNGKFQGLVEAYLTSLDPHSALYDSVSELYALHVLPRCNEWDAAREYVESCELSDERREAWLDTLIQIKRSQEEQKQRLLREAEEAKKVEVEAKKLRKIRKSKTSCINKKSASSVNGSSSGSTIFSGSEREGQGKAVQIHHTLESEAGTDLTPGRAEKSTSGTNFSTLSTVSNWTRSLTLHFSPRLVKTLLFLALLFGAAGRREIRERIKLALRRAGSTIAAGFRVTYV